MIAKLSLFIQLIVNLFFFLYLVKVFIANKDSDSIVTSAIKPPIDIPRFIRLVPIIWTGAICLRMELYGCPYGMSSTVVILLLLSASSSSSSSSSLYMFLKLSLPNVINALVFASTCNLSNQFFYTFFFTNVAMLSCRLLCSYHSCASFFRSLTMCWAVSSFSLHIRHDGLSYRYGTSHTSFGLPVLVQHTTMLLCWLSNLLALSISRTSPFHSLRHFPHKVTIYFLFMPLSLHFLFF